MLCACLSCSSAWRSSPSFSVVHFAGPVKYGVTEVDKTKFLPKSRWAKEKISEDSPTIDGFTVKNRDKVTA